LNDNLNRPVDISPKIQTQLQDFRLQILILILGPCQIINLPTSATAHIPPTSVSSPTRSSAYIPFSRLLGLRIEIPRIEIDGRADIVKDLEELFLTEWADSLIFRPTAKACETEYVNASICECFVLYLKTYITQQR